MLPLGKTGLRGHGKSLRYFLKPNVNLQLSQTEHLILIGGFGKHCFNDNGLIRGQSLVWRDGGRNAYSRLCEIP